MANYPNQKTITIAARVARDKVHPYCMFNIQAMQQAMATIRTVGGIKIWMYLNKNVDNYSFDLSRAELMKHWGLTKDTYESGLKELIKLGYLVPINGNENLLTFYETICAENPTKAATLSENPTELYEDSKVSENPTKSTTLEEKQTKVAISSENPTEISFNGFVF